MTTTPTRNNNEGGLYPKFENLCRNIIKPEIFPNLETLTLHYSMTYTFLSVERASVEMKAALQLVETICSRYNQMINIELMGWYLKPLLQMLNYLPNLSACLQSLAIPRVERDIECVTLNHKLNRLTNLSLGHYSSVLMVENVVVQPKNVQALAHFINQLDSLILFKVLGSSDCLTTGLIPNSVNSLDFPLGGLFGTLLIMRVALKVIEHRHMYRHMRRIIFISTLFLVHTWRISHSSA